MTQPSLRIQDYLDHILEAIGRIQRYTAGMDESAFATSELVHDAVIRNIEVIGEAANNIRRHAPDFSATHAQIPWEVMYAMRNRVAHGYFKIDFEIVWKTIQHDLPTLEAQIKPLVNP